MMETEDCCYGDAPEHSVKGSPETIKGFKSNQILFVTCAEYNRCSRPYREILTYKPLTNNAVQEVEQVTLAFLGTGTMVVCLKHVGTTDSVREMFKMSVKTLASWSTHALSTRQSRCSKFRS